MPKNHRYQVDFVVKRRGTVEATSAEEAGALVGKINKSQDLGVQVIKVTRLDKE